MPTPLNDLPHQRIASVDALRGATFVLMLFVNSLGGASGIPPGIHHVAAGIDGMGLADIVFPAFLFAVGMSIPFAINSRIAKGDSLAQLLWHIGYRAFGLIVIGFFMVNMESGYNENAMGMRIELWSLTFYAALALVWGVYRFEHAIVNHVLRFAGVALIVWLGAVYRSGDEGTGSMTPQWWGILGCIGWTYLAASVLYLLARGRAAVLAGAISLCVACFAYTNVHHSLGAIAMHASHLSIVLAGVVCALLFFDGAGKRFSQAAVFMAALAISGWLLHGTYPVSKIGATPPWALYCAALCVGAFTLLYWVTEARTAKRWTGLLEPAAASPLITYLIPFVLGALMGYFDLRWDPSLTHGAGAIAFALLYTAVVLLVVSRLNALNVKLKL